jgi:DNA-binding response OmpR family regulator
MMGRQPAHILVVDDEATIRFTLATLLRRCGYSVAAAENGVEALMHCERQACDLILLDLIMPGMNGVAVAQRVRALQPTATIIILTGSDMLMEVEMGGYAYVRKTASPQEVLARVAAALAEPTAVTQSSDDAGRERTLYSDGAVAER